MFLKVAKILSVKVAPYINSAVSASLSSRRVRLEKNKKVKEESLSPQEESVESTVVMSSSSPRPKSKMTKCRNRKESFIAEATEPDASRAVPYFPCDNISKSSEGCEFRGGSTSVCGERPWEDNEYSSLIGNKKPRNSKKITSYGTVSCQEANGDIGICRDLSGDNDSCSSASDGHSSSASSGVLTSKMTNRQAMVLAMVLVNSFSSSLTVCLFPPFYPRLAEMKGTTASSYGMIIGTNCLVAFLTTPFIGNQLPRIGVKFSFCFGTFAGGMCCALSGLLEFFEPGQSFIIFSVLLRLFHAVANALVITSTFAYQAMEFPGSVAKVFSITRCVMNVTQLFGPLMGGVLHEAGGFFLPFAVMGGFQIILAFLSVSLMPPPLNDDSEDEDREYGHSKKKNKLSVCKILSIPTIWFSFVAFIIATMCNGFISVNLEPEVLRQFQLSPIYIGLVFGLKDGANSIASPIWGFVCDNNKKSVKPYLIVSAILVAVSFLILGAGELLGFAVSLTIPSLVAALCVNGVGIGGQQVVGVVDALHEASRAGYPENPATQGLVAGMWSSLSGAGRFVSRAGSGLLVDVYGFSPVTSIACGLQLVVALVTFIYLVTCECSLVARESGLKWEDVTIVEHGRRREDQVVFANSNSPSESLMAHSVQVGVSIASQKGAPRIANSMPPNRRWSFSEEDELLNRTKSVS